MTPGQAGGGERRPVILIFCAFQPAGGKGQSLGCLCSAINFPLLSWTVSHQSPGRRDPGKPRAAGRALSSPKTEEMQKDHPRPSLKLFPLPGAPFPNRSWQPPTHPPSPPWLNPCNRFLLEFSIFHVFNSYLLNQSYSHHQGVCTCCSLCLELFSSLPLTLSLCPLSHKCSIFVNQPKWLRG